MMLSVSLFTSVTYNFRFCVTLPQHKSLHQELPRQNQRLPGPTQQEHKTTPDKGKSTNTAVNDQQSQNHVNRKSNKNCPTTRHSELLYGQAVTLHLSYNLPVVQVLITGLPAILTDLGDMWTPRHPHYR